MRMNHSVSIIIPARNERGNIEEIVKRLPAFPADCEVIFVEGHSRDGTLEEILRIKNKYAAFLPIKYAVQGGIGKADAIWRGFALASNDVLMILDADMGVRPEQLSKFYEKIRQGAQFVNGTRLIYAMEKGAMRPLNYMGNKFFTSFVNWISGQKLTDTLCGTKVLFRSDFERIKETELFKKFSDPFGDFTLLFCAAEAGLKIEEVPVRYCKRKYGTTKINRFRDGWALLKLVFKALFYLKLFPT